MFLTIANLPLFTFPLNLFLNDSLRTNCPGSNPVGVEIFRTLPDRPWGPPSLLYKGYLLFSGGKAAGTCLTTNPPSSAGVKERVKFYIYSSYGSLWPVLGWTLPFTYLTFNFFLSVGLVYAYAILVTIWTLSYLQGCYQWRLCTVNASVIHTYNFRTDFSKPVKMGSPLLICVKLSNYVSR